MNLNQYATGNAQPGLSVRNLLHIKMRIPDTNEQQKIVSQIEQYEQDIQKAEYIIQQSSERKKAILTKYLA